MKYNTVDIRFEGSKFYPSKLKERTKLPIDILAEYGVISSIGRYKGQRSPYGIGLLDISSPGKENNVNDLIREYCIKLLEWKDVLKECGVDEIIIDIENSREFPMDISLSNDLLFNLSTINARVELHSSHDDENADNGSIEGNMQMLNKNELYQKVLTSLKKHPFINDTKAIPYFIYFFSVKHYSDDVDDNLNKFEDFYKEVVKH